jgi:ParB family chromosome partitioning protein
LRKQDDGIQMKKTSQTEAEFNASLAPRLLGGARSAAPMHMNDLPLGASKSLTELLRDEPEGAGKPPQQPAPLQLVEVAAPDNTQNIGLHLIVDSPYQPRKKYDETELQLLGETLKRRGQDEPVMVRKLASGKYELIAGHRRVRAARLIGWSEIGARVVTLGDREACIATLVHNESNVKLSDYERGMAYRTALKEGYASTQAEVASIFGCTQARVSQCLGLFDLPAPVLALMDKYPELVTYRKARVIKEVLAQYPTEHDSITRSVEELIDNPQMDQSELRALLVKPFEKKRVRLKPSIPKTISDRNGESAFRIQVKSRDIHIQVEEGVDVEQALHKAVAALREFASTLDVLKKNSAGD